MRPSIFRTASWYSAGPVRGSGTKLRLWKQAETGNGCFGKAASEARSTGLSAQEDDRCGRSKNKGAQTPFSISMRISAVSKTADWRKQRSGIGEQPGSGLFSVQEHQKNGSICGLCCRVKRFHSVSIPGIRISMNQGNIRIYTGSVS